MNVTPSFFHIWGLVWHGVIGWLLICGLLLFSPNEKEPERTLGAFLPGFLWLRTRGPLTFFPPLWFADHAVLLPFVLVGLAEVIVAHALLRERHRRWIAWSLPGLIFWGTYTDWLFVPFCAVILVYRLLRHRDVRVIFPAFVRQVAVPAALAITLFMFQLFWVLGSHFVSTLLERFLVRSMDTAGAFERHESLLWYVYGHFVEAMGGLTIALLVDAPVDRQAREWEEAVRRSLGYYDVLFTPEPSFEIPEKPSGNSPTVARGYTSLMLNELPSCA